MTNAMRAKRMKARRCNARARYNRAKSRRATRRDPGVTVAVLVRDAAASNATAVADAEDMIGHGTRPR
jgi:hypothetical protein